MDGSTGFDILTAFISSGTLVLYGLIGIKQNNRIVPGFPPHGEIGSVSSSPWTKYTSSQHNFSVDFPGIPTVVNDPNTIEDIDVSDTLYKVEKEGIAVWVQVLGYLKSQIDITTDPHSHLAMFTDILALEPDVSITCYENSVRFLGNPAITIDIQRLNDQEDISTCFLCFIYDNSIFELVTEGRSGLGAEIKLVFNRFVSSFHFD